MQTTNIFEKDTAVILDSIDIGERDVKIIILGISRGRIELVARGAKDIKAKMRGKILRGAFGNFVWSCSANRTKILIAADSVNPLAALDDIEARQASCMALNFLENMTHYGEKNPSLINLVYRFFVFLSYSNSYYHRILGGEGLPFRDGHDAEKAKKEILNSLLSAFAFKAAFMLGWVDEKEHLMGERVVREPLGDAARILRENRAWPEIGEIIQKNILFHLGKVCTFTFQI